MRKPPHALAGAPALSVTVFEKGKRHALYNIEGTDPSNIALQASQHQDLNDAERPHVRAKVNEALKRITAGSIPNLIDAQLDIGGRRVRIKAAA